MKKLFQDLEIGDRFTWIERGVPDYGCEVMRIEISELLIGSTGAAYVYLHEDDPLPGHPLKGKVFTLKNPDFYVWAYKD